MRRESLASVTTNPATFPGSAWQPEARGRALEQIGGTWDVLIIGGGITGAGILSAAARSGVKVLLIEQRDFAAGTSSRSSKLVHGGLRYLKRMAIGLTRASVAERQDLLRTAAGLVRPLQFLYPVYDEDRTRPWLVGLGLKIYTHLAAGTGGYERLNASSTRAFCPSLSGTALNAAFVYQDAQTDDARLVLRVLQDGVAAADGRAVALSYVCVDSLLIRDSKVTGVVARDMLTGVTREVTARVVINATGVWADRLREGAGGKRRLRPLRGSHLFFPLSRLPLKTAVGFAHPRDGRPVFAYPWEGVILVGTTDVDHPGPLDEEPSISEAEAEYLLEAVRFAFPAADLSFQDVLTTQAGVRPVIDTGKQDPSAESRDHALWLEDGLLTVTGGKLTTFRLVAWEALRRVRSLVPNLGALKKKPHVLDPVLRSAPPPGWEEDWDRLVSRYGNHASAVAASGSSAERIPGTPYTVCELLWSAENEGVVHLSDLMLRRLRLGVLLPDGGWSVLGLVEHVFRERHSWDRQRWEEEVRAFLAELERGYRLPAPARQGGAV